MCKNQDGSRRQAHPLLSENPRRAPSRTRRWSWSAISLKVKVEGHRNGTSEAAVRETVKTLLETARRGPQCGCFGGDHSGTLQSSGGCWHLRHRSGLVTSLRRLRDGEGDSPGVAMADMAVKVVHETAYKRESNSEGGWW